MRLHLRVYRQDIFWGARNKWWEIVKTEVVSFTGTWNEGEVFIKTSSTGDGVQYGFRYAVTGQNVYQELDRPISATRVFEAFSGVAEVSHYGDLISRSCDNGPEHQIVYVNESVTEDQLINYDGLAITGLKLRSSNSLQSLDQLRCYMRKGV